MIKKSSIIDPADPAIVSLHQQVSAILQAARQNIARTVNTGQVIANWLIGRAIVEEEQTGQQRANYGGQLLAGLSNRLKLDFGPGYGVDNLELFRRFYLTYQDLLPSENSDAVRRNFTSATLLLQVQRHGGNEVETGNGSRNGLPDWQPGQHNPNLSWTHYRRLLRIDRLEARSFYEMEAVRNNWSARELERQIASLLFDRLAKSRDKQGVLRLATHGQEIVQAIDVLKDPLVLEFLDLPVAPRLVESTLEQALISNLQAFLLELGKGFAFVARQERITLDGDHFYIDLVFYHTILKCFVLIDLKVGKLSHADLGQIQFYVNYYDRERRTEGDNPSIGLILCPDKNDAVVRYTLGEQQDKNIFVSRYQLHLPTVEQLESELRRELRLWLPKDEAGVNDD